MALFPPFPSRASPSTLTARASTAASSSSAGERSAPLGSWEFSAPFSVGRSRRCELKIPTNKDTLTVSKRHVGVVPLAEAGTVTVGAGHDEWSFARRQWVLFDMEPMNGTAVNGVEMDPGGTHTLRDGDVVVLASTMRQCVQLTVRFSDRAYSSISIRAIARTLSPPTPTPAPAPSPSPSPSAPSRAQAPTPTNSFATEFRSIAAMEVCRSPIHVEEVPVRSILTSRGREEMIAVPMASKRSRVRTPDPEGSSRHRRHDSSEEQQRKRTRRSETTVWASEDQPTEDESQATQSWSHPTTGSMVPTPSNARISQSSASTGLEQERERFMACPVCLDYFHASATLPCSHTFCGYCISSWFRTSLSCPECRDTVRAVPVRNRALDDLVQRLVGDTDAYKALVERRSKQQQEAAAQTIPISTNIFGALSPTRHAHRHHQPSEWHANVFNRWSVEEKHSFSSFVGTQFGEARVASLRKIGLSERSVESASTTEIMVAAQNLLLDCGALRGVGDDCRQRLKIFLFYG